MLFEVTPIVDFHSSGLDVCRALEVQMSKSRLFRVFFFFLGVCQQLQNLDLLPKDQQVVHMDSIFIPCWWRLYDSGYRPTPEELQTVLVVLAQEGADLEIVKILMVWYHRYLEPDFLSKL